MVDDSNAACFDHPLPVGFVTKGTDVFGHDG